MKLSSFLILALAGNAAACGKDSHDKKKHDAPVVNESEGDRTKENLEQACRDQGGTVGNGECKRQTPSGAHVSEDQCAKKGDDYKWENGQCSEVANIKLVGELSAQPGLIWEATTATCDKIVTVDGEYYTNCAGIDVTIPMPTLENQKSQNSVVIVMNCEALEPLATEVSIPGGFDVSGGMSGIQTFAANTQVEAGEEPMISIKLTSTTFLQPVKAGCNIKLETNSVGPFEG